MAESKRQVEIGFAGGQVMPVRMQAESLRDLRAALDAGAGWVDFESDDGTIAIDVSRVVFLKVESSEQRVGF